MRLAQLVLSKQAEIREIRRSGRFDRTYYVTAHGHIHPVLKRLPVLHYLLNGERIGLRPEPGFSARAYLHNNPELANVLVGTGRSAYAHWLTEGRHEGRVVIRGPGEPLAPGEAMPSISRSDLPDSPADAAVHLHLHYPELWPAISERLASQLFDFDLFVTLTPRARGVRSTILDDFPRAVVWDVPNRGRDILPFLHLAREGVFDPYRAVAKIHGKRSPHRQDGDSWRDRLLDGVLSEPRKTEARLAALLADDRIQLATADGQILAGDIYWGQNRQLVERLAAKIGLALPPGPLRFPAGSIYWIKRPTLERLRRLDLAPEDFEPEQGLVDGTVAHAIERLVGYLVVSAGGAMATASELDRRNGNGMAT